MSRWFFFSLTKYTVCCYILLLSCCRVGQQRCGHHPDEHPATGVHTRCIDTAHRTCARALSLCLSLLSLALSRSLTLALTLAPHAAHAHHRLTYSPTHSSPPPPTHLAAAAI